MFYSAALMGVTITSASYFRDAVRHHMRVSVPGDATLLWLHCEKAVEANLLPRIESSIVLCR